jgi:DNA polymerase bacteriophage-type
MRKLYIDLECYYDTKIGYDLKSMSMTEFIRDPRFKVHGCGCMMEGYYKWVPGDKMESVRSLPWNEIELIAHNVKFDGGILAWRYSIHPARYFDTVSLSRAILGQNIQSYSLKSVAAYLGLAPKGELGIDGLASLTSEQEAKLIEYNKTDLQLCSLIDAKLRGQFPDGQLGALDWTTRAFINPVLELDVDRLEKMVAKERIKKADIFLKLGIDKEIFSSNKKFEELLHERKIDVPTKPSPRNPAKTVPAFSLTDPGFIALKETHSDLYEARVAAKSTIVETRGDNLAAIGRTGAFPFDVQFSGAIGTHRYSGGSGAGGNPQNFPRKGDMRRSIIAPSGSMLVVGDFSAIEARIVAWLAKEPKIVSGFLQEDDIYSQFASTVYGRPINKKDNPRERQVGKTCILGLGYNMGAKKFKLRIKQDAGITIDDKEAYRIVNLYRSTYGNIPLLWRNAGNLLPQMVEGNTSFIPFAPFLRLERNAIKLPSGLRIQYPNLRYKSDVDEWVYDVYKRKYDAEGVKLYGGKIIENICQALAGEICKIAINRAEERGLRVVGQVHDEILVVSPQERAERDINTLMECMQTPISWWPTLRLSAEVHSGKSWAEAKQ